MTTVSFQLPPGWSAVPTVPFPAEGPEGWGPPDAPVLLATFTSQSADELLDSLEESGRKLRERPVHELVRVLGRLGRRFTDPRDALRREAEPRIAEEARLSLPMVREIVDGMARDWLPDRLERMVRADFPDPAVLDEFRAGPCGDLLRAIGGPLALHIGSGNVPGVGATSMIRSLLVKCPLLLKPGRGDVALSCLFARGLQEEDEDLAASVAVVYWPGGAESALEARGLKRAGRVVVYGGPELVRDLRARLPPSVSLVVYPQRMSMGAVAREALVSEDAARTVADEAARAVALFEQRGCVSPQVIWVETGGDTSPAAWAELLAGALEKMHHLLPPGPTHPGTAGEMAQLKGLAELREASGTVDRVISATHGRWTVLVEPADRMPLPCTGRVVRVKPVDRLEELGDRLQPLASVLQSLAIAAPEPRRAQLADQLAHVGLTRITTFDKQPFPAAWWRHDGQGPLAALVRWVAVESD